MGSFRPQQAQPPPFQPPLQPPAPAVRPPAAVASSGTGVFASGVFAGGGGSGSGGAPPSLPSPPGPLAAPFPPRTRPPAELFPGQHAQHHRPQQQQQQQQRQQIAPVFAAAAARQQPAVPPRSFPPPSAPRVSAPPPPPPPPPPQQQHQRQQQFRQPNPQPLYVPPQQQMQLQQQQQQQHQPKQQLPVLSASFAVAPDAAGVDVSVSDSDVLRQALVGVGASWSSDTRAWRIPFERAAEAEHALRATTAAAAGAASDCGFRLVLEPLPDVAARILRAAAGARDDSALYGRIPERLERALMAFQREGVRFALRRGGRALIGDEMGLGKTVQALAVAAAYAAEWPALIVAPSSLREAWADALGEWLGIRGSRVLVATSAKEGEAIAPGPCAPHDFVIVSYGLVGKLKPKLEAARFGLVILDESHYVKDAKAQRTRDTVPLAAGAPRCLLLSGTPALARPKELFKQLDAILPSARLTMRSFGERYCVAERPSRFGGPFDGASNLEELNRVLVASAMVRRLKRDVLTQLPPKRRQQVFLTLNAAEKKQLAGLSKQLESARAALAANEKQFVTSGGAAGRAFGGGGDPSSAAAPAGAFGDATSALSGDERRAVMHAYQHTAALKVRAVQGYVDELLENGDKFLIFAHHRELLDGVSFSLNKARVPFIRIDGSVPPQKRQGLVNDFQQRGDVRAAVLSISAAGTGLTLTAASVVVFAELSWTPGQVVQAEDRAHRIGQPCSVNVYYLHVKGSVDDLVWQALASKLDAVGQAVDGEAGTLGVAAASKAAAAAPLPAGQATIEQLFGGGGKGRGKKRSLAEEAAEAEKRRKKEEELAEGGEYDDGFSSPVEAGGGGNGGGGGGGGGDGNDGAAAAAAFEDDDGFSSPVGPASDENEAPSGAA